MQHILGSKGHFYDFLQLTNGIFLAYTKNLLEQAITEVLTKGVPSAPYFVNVPLTNHVRELNLCPKIHCTQL
jgi:hypothetical protein